MPFRSDLDAAEAREGQLENELEQAKQHADALRDKQRLQADPAPAPAPAPRASKRSLKRYAMYFSGPLIVAGAFVGLPAFANLTAASCGYRSTVISAVEDCPEAAQALGDDIHIAYVGIACGSTRVGDHDDGGPDRARWRVPISGSKSSGVYHFVVVDPGGGWVMASGAVTVDGKDIDLRQCGKPATKPGLDDSSPAGILANKCESGEARACRDLASLYEDGNVVDKDAEASRRYADKACRLGLASACRTDRPAEQPETQP